MVPQQYFQVILFAYMDMISCKISQVSDMEFEIFIKMLAIMVMNCFSYVSNKSWRNFMF